MITYPEDGLKGSTVIIVALVLIAALVFLKLTPDLPIDVDIGGAATIAKNEVPYTEKELLGDFLGTCEDSDGGLNERVKGVVNAGGESAEDECSDNTKLVEYFCENKQLKFNFIPCDEYCLDGKCISKPKVKEYFKFSQKSDGLEIDEKLGDVIKALTSIELDALRGSYVTTQDGKTKVNQYIRFKDGGLDSGSVTFKKDESGNAEDYLYFAEDDEMFEYEIEFEEGLRSSIVNGVLTALKNKKISLLGREYKVATATVSDGSAKIAFMSGAIEDSLNEGESKQYQLDGVDYEIQAAVISDANPAKVTLKINGEQTEELNEGDLFFTTNGVAIGIEDILNSEAGEAASDSVRIFVGAEEIEFQDAYGDTSFSSGVSVNKEIIDAGSVSIIGQKSGDEFEFSSLKYRLKADAAEGSGVYVKKKHGLREFIQEPEGIFGGWDIVYGGLMGSKGSSTTVVEIKPRGGDAYNLVFTSRGGVYSIPFVSNRGNFKLGSNQYDLLFKESGSSGSFFIDKEDLFVVNSEADTGGFSSVLRYNGIDVSSKVVHFDDMASGGKSAVYTGEPGIDAQGSLVVGGVSFKFFIGPAPDYSLSMDLDNSGSVDSGEAKIVIAGGGILDLGSTNTPGGSFDITLTTAAKLRDEPGKGAEVITINILKTSNGVDLNVPDQDALQMNSVDGERIDMTPVGVYVRQITSDDADKLQIGYGRGGQQLADVAIVIIEQEKPLVKVAKNPTGFAVLYDLF